MAFAGANKLLIHTPVQSRRAWDMGTTLGNSTLKLTAANHDLVKIVLPDSWEFIFCSVCGGECIFFFGEREADGEQGNAEDWSYEYVTGNGMDFRSVPTVSANMHIIESPHFRPFYPCCNSKTKSNILQLVSYLEGDREWGSLASWSENQNS